MTTRIFYFSGTGNTLKLAKDLSAELEGAELVRITYDMDFNHKDCDVVGIAYPVYCFGIPNIVTNFIHKVQLKLDAYIFGLASYGGLLTSSGRILQKQLERRGYALSAGFAINMPGNAQTVYNVPKQEKIKAMYVNEQKRIEAIARIIKNRETAAVDTNYGILGKLMSGVSSAMMSKIGTTARSFFTDENCDSCGICTQVCPVSNIAMNNGKPAWGYACEACMACFHWCPRAAIQASPKTKLRGRYHHPDVTLKEIIPEK